MTNKKLKKVRSGFNQKEEDSIEIDFKEKNPDTEKVPLVLFFLQNNEVKAEVFPDEYDIKVRQQLAGYLHAFTKAYSDEISNSLVFSPKED